MKVALLKKRFDLKQPSQTQNRLFFKKRLFK